MRLFGTDGIRGRANEAPLSPEVIVRIGRALATLFGGPQEGCVADISATYRPFNPYVKNARTSHQFTVVIGKDTRLSGYMIESALVAGLVAQGANVIMLGPIPTPAIAFLTRSLRADIGVMISASHNPYYDNGIKLFDASGVKLARAKEEALEALVESGAFPACEDCGKSLRLDDAAGRYVEYVKATFPKGRTLEGLQIVLDCANGAAYKVAPRVLWELGASVIPLADTPNGRNINDHCGALHPENMQKCLQETRGDLGIALDGDADRVFMMTPRGQVVDGDQILALIAREAQRNGTLKGGVVSTCMSNLGLIRFLEGQGIAHFESAVGDKNVVALMQDAGCNVGGEASGHIILGDHSTTGDGLMAALQVLSVAKALKVPLDDLFPIFQPLPQKTCNFPWNEALGEAFLGELRQDLKRALGAEGRVIVRRSGTEPLLRLMLQGPDEALLSHLLEEVSQRLTRGVA